MARRTAPQLKSDDVRINDESSDWLIVRLHSKVKAAEIKYSDLLCRIHKFINDISRHLEIILQKMPEDEQEKVNRDVDYFLNTQDSLFSSQLFADFKHEVLEKLHSKDFMKENYKAFLIKSINDLTHGLGLKESGGHEKKKSQPSFELSESSNLLRRELTPVRSSKRSISPSTKNPHNYQKENAELRQSLLEMSKQRDILKA